MPSDTFAFSERAPNDMPLIMIGIESRIGLGARVPISVSVLHFSM